MRFPCKSSLPVRAERSLRESAAKAVPEPWPHARVHRLPAPALPGRGEAKDAVIHRIRLRCPSGGFSPSTYSKCYAQFAEARPSRHYRENLKKSETPEAGLPGSRLLRLPGCAKASAPD